MRGTLTVREVMSKQQNVDLHLRDLAYKVLDPFFMDFLERIGISPGMSG
jgi:hypothetical protein